MKHWIAGQTFSSHSDDPAISLDIGEDGYRVVSIAHNAETGAFTLTEECDGYFSANCTGEKMLEALMEAADWVRARNQAGFAGSSSA